MTKSIVTILPILILSCQSEPSSKEKRQALNSIQMADTTSSDKNSTPVADTFILHPTGSKDISKFYDTTINNIPFNDCDTIEHLFGDNFTLLPDIDDLPRIQIFNSDRTKLLTMYMWNGSAKCDFSQYQIEYSSLKTKYPQNPFTLNMKDFTSSRNISLGLTPAQLQLKIGKPTEVKQENGLSIYSYQQYNDLYFADYYFKGSKLIKFRYGYEYP